jgi:branched-chain amino acid transport system permease protein
VIEAARRTAETDKGTTTRVPGAPLDAGAIATTSVVLLIAVLFPLLTNNLSYMSTATLILIYAALAQCWNLVMGVAGIWSFAQVGLFAVGAYCNVLLMVKLGVPSLLALLAGGVGALIAGVLVGIPSVRLRGVYVVLFTLALQEILRILIATDDSGFTGGSFGLYGFDAFGFAERLSPMGKATALYYLGLFLTCVVAYTIYRVMWSPVGLAFRSMRDAEPYAVARGVDRRKFQIFVFAFTAFLTGLVGAFYADYVGTATPSILTFDLVSLLLAIMVIGGWGTYSGPLLGAVVVVILSERLRDSGEWRLLTLGLIMMFIIIVFPKGLVGLVSSVTSFRHGLRPRIERWLED